MLPLSVGPPAAYSAVSIVPMFDTRYAPGCATSPVTYTCRVPNPATLIVKCAVGLVRRMPEYALDSRANNRSFTCVMVRLATGI